MTSQLQNVLHSILPERTYKATRARWRQFLRLKTEGFYTAYQRTRLWPKILRTPPVYTEPVVAGAELCVHLMCYRGDYLAAIWALKSFYHQSRKPLPLTIHIQGESTPLMERPLLEHFPNARFVLQEEADRVVEGYLTERKLERLLRMRRAIPTVQKLTDFLTMATTPRIIILDADLLFFDRPDELTDLAGAPADEFLIQRDFIDAYTIPPERGKSDFGIDLQRAINVGIVRVTPEVIDLVRCDQYLAHPEFEQLEGHTEQTLWALEASRRGVVSFLPPTYYISLGEPVDCSTLKVRHYAGLSRGMFTREGIPYLIQSGFLDALQKRSPNRRPSTKSIVDVKSRLA